MISKRKENERKEKEREGENSLLGVWEGEKEERREERRVESQLKVSCLDRRLKKSDSLSIPAYAY